jgi:hypothetical protein
VALFHSCPLLRPWPGCYTTPATIKTSVISGVANNGTVNISIVYYGSVYTYNSSVVTETVSVPPATPITMTAIAVAIINATIKAYMRPPVAGIKSVYTAGIAPVSRSPVKAGIWWGHPYTGHPVVTAFVIIIGPVTRLPYIAINRAFRLYVNP